jgi:hypothetical protein
MNASQRTAPGPFGDSVGRPRSHRLIWLVVLAAGGADVVTFYQVLILVLNVPELMVWVAVIGFTAVSLALAHHAGQKARQALTPRHSVGSATIAWAAGAVWLMLGLLAFAVRYVIADASTSDTSSITVLGGSAAAPVNSVDLTSQHLAALMFLGLYVSTGFVTGLGGFMRIDPAAEQLGRAWSQQSKLVRSLGEVREWMTKLDRTLEAIEAARVRTLDQQERAEQLCEDLAKQLRAKARLRLMNRRRPEPGPELEIEPEPELEIGPEPEPEPNSNQDPINPERPEES